MRSSPSRRFTSVDLPTFGRPTTATRGPSSSASASISGSDGELREDRVHQRRDALAVRGGDRVRRAEPEFVELRGRDRGVQPLGLVRDEPDARARLPQLPGDPAILRRHALARVGEEDDRVGLGDRRRRLLRHLAEQSVSRHRLEPAGIDDVVRPVPEPAVAVVPVAREAGGVGDERVPRPRQAVEESRLADVGPADDDDGGFHCCEVGSLPRGSPPLASARPAAHRPSARREGVERTARSLHEEAVRERHRRRAQRRAVGRDPADERAAVRARADARTPAGRRPRSPRRAAAAPRGCGW